MMKKSKNSADNQPTMEEVNSSLSQIAGEEEPPMEPEAVQASFAERINKIKLHRNKGDVIAKTIHNTYKVLTGTPGLEKLFGRNVLTGEIVTLHDYDTRLYGFGDVVIAKATKIDELQIVKISRVLNGIFVTDFGVDRIRQAIEESADRRKFNPIKNYLDGVVWDRLPRLDSWLIDFAGAEDTKYVQAVARKWMIQAVARAIRPGCHADSVLILEGKQGVGKNFLMESLLPDPDWAVSFNSSEINKDMVVSLEGKWFGEFCEMYTASRAEVKSLKAFISQRIDNYRKVYRRDHKAHPRLTVFWGGTNDDEYLLDETGNRRFLPIKVHGTVQIDGLNDDQGNPKLFLDCGGLEAARDQLWAEAYQRFKDGEEYKLTTRESREAELQTKERMIPDPWEGPVEDYLRGGKTKISTTSIPDVLQCAISLDIQKRTVADDRRVRKILRKLGYEPVVGKENKKTVRQWVRVAG